MKNIPFYLTILFSVVVLGQQNITGTVFDGEFNEPMPFANVTLKGTSNGTTTDFDGRYNFDVTPGEYTVVFSFVGYETLQVTEIMVEVGKEVNVDAILNPASNALEEVIVVSTAKRNTEVSVLNIQKKAVNMLDGLSVQSMKKAGDSDIAGAIKRVPGIAVQEGKYVYVRGLGDRYSKTMINGISIPGLDPNKNTVQMDIFPTGLVDNILVNKSASSNLPADFTGGLVDIKLKDFSNSPQYNISFGYAYNPEMHYKDNYIRDRRGSNDFLAKDDGYRDLPFDSQTEVGRPLFFLADQADMLTQQTRSFSKKLSPIQDTSSPDFNFSLSASNNYEIGNEASVGYIASFGYDSETKFYEDYSGTTAITNNAKGEIETFDSYDGRLGQKNILTNALFGLTFKNKKNRVSINLLSINNSESNAVDYTLEDYINTEYTASEYGLYYTERNVLFVPLTGKHTSDFLDFEWKFAKAKINVDDKDFKTTAFEHGVNTEGEQVFFISPSSTGYPERLWRFLEEDNTTAQIDLTGRFNLFGYEQKVKFGASRISKIRSFNTAFFTIGFNGQSELLEGNPDNLFKEGNIWTKENFRYGSYLKGGYSDKNQYEAESETQAAYFSAELKLNENLRAVLGVRYESFSSNFTGLDLFNNEYNKSKFINDSDLYPQANLIYSVKEDLNVRISYYKTTARPSFKEVSPVNLYDPIDRLRFIGNTELESSFIDNFDFRIEKFGQSNQMLALSLFRKDLDNPIEVGHYSKITNKDFTPRNSPKATVNGIEFEIRQNIIDHDNVRLSFNANASIVDVKLTMTEEEYDSRLDYVEEGETISKTRDLQGQSPYMINAGAQFLNKRNALELGVYYNVQGKSLKNVSNGRVPDIYNLPYNDLNFNLSKPFGKDKKKNITLKIKNILNDEKRSEYQIDGFNSKYFSLYSPGREFSVSYSIKF